LNVRVIPRMDIKGPNLVKGVHLEGLRVLGKPEQFARYYYERGADELVYIDVVASLYGRNSLHDIVERTSREIYVPLCVGGGLRTIDDIRDILRVGADKVSLNTAAIGNPDIIRQAAKRFGSSTILVSIEAMRNRDGSYEALTNNGRESTGVDAIEWARKATDFGAGELMVTSIDREGTGEGFDLELVERIARSVGVPVIACGGAGSPDDVVRVVREGWADAISLASILHYGSLKDASAMDYSAEGNIEFLAGGRPPFSKIRPSTIAEVKEALIEAGIDVRPVTEAA
jgi:imidazole glycerol-phosphate synthase subunit HisF